MRWTRRSKALSADAAATSVQPTARVILPLEVDEDGWPPVVSERVWAFDLGNDLYRINNVPWFAHDLAIGDVVRATSPDPTLHPQFVEVVERSDHVTVRIIVFDGGPFAGDLARALAPFTALGVYGEGAEQYGMLALDIGPSVPLEPVITTLRRGVTDGSWDVEEGRITRAWVDATDI